MAAVLHFIGQLASFVINHYDLIVELVPVVYLLLRATKWGQHNEKALIEVAAVIESLGDPELKADVARRIAQQKPGVKNAIEHAVNVVDPKKSPVEGLAKLVKIFLGGAR